MTINVSYARNDGTYAFTLTPEQLLELLKNRAWCVQCG
jgi:hypothetical protein